MNILESPGKAVMNGTTTEEAILVAMNNMQNDLLKSIGKDLGYKLKTAIQERDRAKVIDCHRSIRLRYQSDMSIIDALQIQISSMELFT